MMKDFYNNDLQTELEDFNNEYFKPTNLTEGAEIIEHCENLVGMLEIDKQGSKRNTNIKKQILKLFYIIATPEKVKKMNQENKQRLADILDILKITAPDKKK